MGLQKFKLDVANAMVNQVLSPCKTSFLLDSEHSLDDSCLRAVVLQRALFDSAESMQEILYRRTRIGSYRVRKCATIPDSLTEILSKDSHQNAALTCGMMADTCPGQHEPSVNGHHAVT